MNLKNNNRYYRNCKKSKFWEILTGKPRSPLGPGRPCEKDKKLLLLAIGRENNQGQKKDFTSVPFNPGSP